MDKILHSEELLLISQEIENFYELERQFMSAVAAGLSQKAEQILTQMGNLQYKQRTTDLIRNKKNYLVILNTILRVAANMGTVHPYHIDKLSSFFAHRIEAAPPRELDSLPKEMIHRYCALVKQHSLKGYSPFIQKTLTNIELDLTADLSLKAQAKLMNMNPSYLSTLFKKEVGMTLTEYVTRKRMNHAMSLLSTTDLQIQTISQDCGIEDVNYFTKLFKKVTGMTPRDYRKMFPK